MKRHFKNIETQEILSIEDRIELEKITSDQWEELNITHHDEGWCASGETNGLYWETEDFETEEDLMSYLRDEVQQKREFDEYGI